QEGPDASRRRRLGWVNSRQPGAQTATGWFINRNHKIALNRRLVQRPEPTDLALPGSRLGRNHQSTPAGTLRTDVSNGAAGGQQHLVPPLMKRYAYRVYAYPPGVVPP